MYGKKIKTQSVTLVCLIVAELTLATTMNNRIRSLIKSRICDNETTTIIKVQL